MAKIGIDKIKNRIVKGLEGKTPLNGDRMTVESFGKDFSDKAKDGLSELSHQIISIKNKSELSKHNHTDNMQKDNEEPTL